MTTTTDKFVLFYGGPGSNWYHAPFQLYGIDFQNTEQAFMWHKAQTFRDTKAADLIIKEGHNPEVAKKIGRSVRDYNNNVWSELRLAFMIQVNIAKFEQNPALCSDFLFAFSERRFVEASPWDKIWGIGLSEIDSRAQNEKQWRGQNLLGIALDKTRSVLQQQLIE